jgi:hypothetical protein
VAIDTVVVPPGATETVILSLGVGDLRAAARVSIQLVNLTGSQTFTGYVYRKKYGMSAWAKSKLTDFESIGPGLSEMADVDVYDSDLLEVRGVYDGAGGDLEVGTSFRKGFRT